MKGREYMKKVIAIVLLLVLFIFGGPAFWPIEIAGIIIYLLARAFKNFVFEVIDRIKK